MATAKLEQREHKIYLAYQAARLYYECDENQEEIASKLEVSRPQVSRLLKIARDNGLVEVKVKNPLKIHTMLEKSLCSIFPLKDAVVVPLSARDPQIIKQKLAKVAANYVSELLYDGMTISLPWGGTMNYFSKSFPEEDLENVTVVQLKGGVSKVPNRIDTFDPVITVARKINGTPCFLPAPSIASEMEMKNIFLQDEKINETIQLSEQAELSVYSIGYLSENSVLVEAGYFSEREIMELSEQGAVGDICSRFFDINGNIVDEDLDNRTIGIELQKFKEKKYSIAIAGGKERIDGILGAIRGGYTNILITDEIAARQVLAQDGSYDENFGIKGS